MTPMTALFLRVCRAWQTALELALISPGTRRSALCCIPGCPVIRVA
jgi:hypothetical protein